MPKIVSLKLDRKNFILLNFSKPIDLLSILIDKFLSQREFDISNKAPFQVIW